MVRAPEYRASSPAHSPQTRYKARRERSPAEAETTVCSVAGRTLLERREQTRRGREGKNKRRSVLRSEELRPRGRFCLYCQSSWLMELLPNPCRLAEQSVATTSPGRQETNTSQC